MKQRAESVKNADNNVPVESAVKVKQLSKGIKTVGINAQLSKKTSNNILTEGKEVKVDNGVKTLGLKSLVKGKINLNWEMIYRIKNCLTSERLRKKLVYQRLENINRLFTGLGLNSWENSMLGKTLIFSGGKIDLEFAAEYLGAQKFDSIVCADSGLEAARLLNQDVDFFMGDFDSVSDDTLKEFMKSKAEYIRYPEEKDETDTELVINWVVENGATEIIILGATGGRLDHLLANINLLIKKY